ncbi:oxygen-independent coproporphyrinogen III oxidase [Hahella sp. SMD15-11]|uniref:Coproporphyrinogen-III oxidase n=1 Tax=Thermohahella caldifontis TaxID=3142973 RepID=A0AB39UZK2_9GAMM
MSTLYFDEALIRKYDLQGPRYTSYPTAVEFSETFSEEDYRKAAADSVAAGRPLSLYMHIPFCARLCYYCACNKIITKRREKAEPYLHRLYREIAWQARHFAGDRQVEQLHWGGGTPTFISPEQMRELMKVTREHFRLRDDDKGDYSIELDPREVDDETLETLREIGFNRVSLGVQDFNEKVQKAVNRIQSRELTLSVLNKARALGFRSINLDLIYGLPFQTPESFAETVDTVLEFAPDRLSVFNYAHLPERFMPQRRIQAEDLPSPRDKLTILEQTIEKLVDAGYVFIGMDHFAKADDELAVAQSKGELHRNFQGYTTHGNCDLVAMGVSSISMMDRHYYQNFHDMEGYEAAMDEGRTPIKRGVILNDDDVLRRAVIMQLICNFTLDKKAISTTFGIDFDTYFAPELDILSGMEKDGLVSLSANEIRVHDSGRLLIRGICKTFDAYLPKAEQKKFSRII